jgi:hypothetical protein
MYICMYVSVIYVYVDTYTYAEGIYEYLYILMFLIVRNIQR